MTKQVKLRLDYLVQNGLFNPQKNICGGVWYDVLEESELQVLIRVNENDLIWIGKKAIRSIQHI